MVTWTGFDESLTGYPALLGSSGGPGVGGLVGLVCRMPSDTHRPEPDELVRKAVHLAGNDDRQPGGRSRRSRPRRGVAPIRRLAVVARQEHLVAAPAARLPRQTVAAADGLGAARRDLAAGRTIRRGRGTGRALCAARRGPDWSEEARRLAADRGTDGGPGPRFATCTTTPWRSTSGWRGGTTHESRSLRLAVEDLTQTFGTALSARARVLAATGAGGERVAAARATAPPDFVQLV